MDGSRVEVMKVLVGSHNYNLNDETSDKDYKSFVTPTFDDLYTGKSYSKMIIGETEDIDIHDIRKLGNLLYKSNVNFLEVLFSNEININKNLNTRTKMLVMTIFDLRDDLVKMNLPALYNSCLGTYSGKVKNLCRPTEKTQHLVDKYSYNTKEALHAYRILDVLDRFLELGFKDFKHALTYFGDDIKAMLDIKNGLYNEGEMRAILLTKEEKILRFKSEYYANGVDLEVKNELDNIIKEIVKEGMKWDMI